MLALTPKSKMRMSDVWGIRKEFPSYSSTEGRHVVTTVKAKTVEEEELPQYEEEVEYRPMQTESLDKSRHTEAVSESVQSKLLTFYESELLKYKKEVERLKMV